MRHQLYPSVPSGDTVAPDQSFRLTRISELDAFLNNEVEERRRMQKKYQRAVKITQFVSAGVGIAGLGMETAGITLMATGVGALPGIVLSALGAGTFIVDLACAVVTRRCSTKAAKHASVEMAARTKLNSVHQLISKALVDGRVTDEEFKLISDEVDRYQAMKEDIRSKARSSAAADEAAKKEWMEQVRAEVAKHMATFNAH